MNQLFDHQTEEAVPVECLGQTFPSDEARRAYYLRLLADKLNDPAFRQQDGFPQAEDEDILALSDPPYFTACPNPFITEYLKQGHKSSEHTSSPVPYTGDLETNSRHPVYSFHPYHTKVPPEVIKTLVQHYTSPGETVLDAFCGTGMTGVAAREVGRNSIVTDFSPIATFIAGVNTKTNPGIDAYLELTRIIVDTKKELGWVYEVEEGSKILEANYYVWSDVFTCPECVHEFSFFPYGVIHHGNKVQTRKSFPCPECAADLSVRKIDRVINSSGKKKKLVWVNAGKGKNRVNREPNAFDNRVMDKVLATQNDSWWPKNEIDIDGYSAKLAQLGDKAISNVSRFLSERNLLVFSKIWERVNLIDDSAIRNLAKSCITSIFTVVSERQGYFGGGGGMSGNMYMPIVRMEKNIFHCLERKIKKMIDAEKAKPQAVMPSIVSTQSATSLREIPDSSIHYIYTDPPFGANIIYSEMNLVLESWLKVLSSETPEAVINEPKNKTFEDYGRLMRSAFIEYYRVLKPGRWITVEFHNTKASVWNLIQTNLTEAGFVIAQVGKLDKGSTTILADIRPGAVVQDLIISAYKPDSGLENRFRQTGGGVESVWDFVENHLRHIPIINENEDSISHVIERTGRIIYDRMVAWFITHGVMVPLSAREFMSELRERYAERDEMFFLDDQVGGYDRARAKHKDKPQIELFVDDERSAIDWLSDFLNKKPATYQDIHPEFVRQLGAGWKKHEVKPELTELLEENFLRYEGEGPVPGQIHSYLSKNYRALRGKDSLDPALIEKAKRRWYVPDPNKAQDLENKREKALLKEFQKYLEFPCRRLKEVRLEVLRAGFKEAYSKKDYQTIVSIAKKIPDESLHEDEKLLLWYDQALTRTDGDL